MIRFKKFLQLTEGGNVKIKTASGEVRAEPIDLSKHSRKTMQDEVHGFLSAVHDHFHAETGHHLFGRNKAALSTGSAFAGSTKAMMGRGVSVTDHQFVNEMGKKHVGDIDVMIPHQHIDHLESILKDGTHSRFGNMKIVGTKRIGTQLHALAHSSTTGKVHQIDFEQSKYEGNHPSAFNQMSTSSPVEDMKAGFKGVVHKFLLNAAIKGSGGFHGRVKDGKGNVKEEGLLPERTFAVSSGMRQAYRKTGEVDEDGVHLAEKIGPKHKPTYETNPKKIAKATFGHPDAEIDSFHGLIRSLKKSTPEHQDRTKIAFKSNLDREKSMSPEMRTKAYNYLEKGLK